MDIVNYNQQAWDGYVDKNNRWTVPVSDKVISNAKNGQWHIVLTPKKPVPANWFPPLKGLKILGLACGGGQQGPVLAALGADVTIFDNSAKQLLQDKIVSDTHGLGITTIQGNMKDLSVFADNSFDLVFNPCSVAFVDNVLPVWQECYRVLQPNGILMTGLTNPIALQLDEETLQMLYPQPYSDTQSLPPEKLEALQQQNEAMIFGHSLTDLMGGQLAAGFMLTNMYEDDWGGDNIADRFFPSFIATRAIKPA